MLKSIFKKAKMEVYISEKDFKKFYRQLDMNLDGNISKNDFKNFLFQMNKKSYHEYLVNRSNRLRRYEARENLRHIRKKLKK